MPLGTYLRETNQKIADVLQAGERFSIGLNNRAKRLKQAIFPAGPGEPAEVPEPRDKAAAQDDIERNNLERERRKRR